MAFRRNWKDNDTFTRSQVTIISNSSNWCGATTIAVPCLTVILFPSQLCYCCFNPLLQSHAYTCQQIKACHLFSTNPLSEAMTIYCQLGHWEHILVNFENYAPFSFKKMYLKMSSAEWWSIYLGVSALSNSLKSKYAAISQDISSPIWIHSHGAPFTTMIWLRLRHVWVVTSIVSMGVITQSCPDFYVVLTKSSLKWGRRCVITPEYLTWMLGIFSSVLFCNTWFAFHIVSSTLNHKVPKSSVVVITNALYNIC